MNPHTQQPLFEDSAEALAPGPVISLAIVPGDRMLGPVQKQFNQLLAKIEAAKATLIELQHLHAKYLPERARRLEPLLAQTRALKEQMVVFLDQRLQKPKGLSKSMQIDITDILVGLAENLIGREDSNPEIEEIYERQAPDISGLNKDGPDGSNEAMMADMQEMLSDVFGMEFDPSDNIDSPEALFEAALDRARKQQEAAEAARAERQSRRKKTARQREEAQETLGADKAVREVYRKLASALHPDREPDAVERARKAALMAQVNAANDRRDLLALLQLQLQIEQLNPQDVAAMADEKLRHFNRVLKEQEKSLNTERVQLQALICESLGMPLSYAVTPRSIESALRREAQRLQADIALMQRDWSAIQQDAGLKRWVREQHELMNEPQSIVELLMRRGTF